MADTKKIDVAYFKWLADQTIEIAQEVTPLVAKILNVDESKIKAFVDFVKKASDVVLKALEAWVNFPVLFGASGEGLTDAEGNLCPDCPCPAELASVAWALKAQAA